jgi:nucleotide-binding universal stress UspA family protein
MSTLIVPLDGSDLAARALPYAAGVARRTGASLRLVRASFAAAAISPASGADKRLAESGERAARCRAEAALAARAAALRHQGIEVDTVAEPGLAAELILREAEAADLVVMSTHGRGGLGRLLYGSVAEAVMRRCPAPMLLVPPGCRSAPPGPGTLRVLVGLDESPLAERLLARLPALGAPGATEVVLLEVVVPPPPGYGFAASGQPGWWDGDQMAMAAARGYVGWATKHLTESGYRARGLVEVGDPVAAIERAAADHRVDVIALASHGRTGLLRLVLGSVAAETIRRAATPVLLIGPRVFEGAREDGSGQAGEQSPRSAGAPVTADPTSVAPDSWAAAG